MCQIRYSSHVSYMEFLNHFLLLIKLQGDYHDHYHEHRQSVSVGIENSQKSHSMPLTMGMHLYHCIPSFSYKRKQGYTCIPLPLTKGFTPCFHMCWFAYYLFIIMGRFVYNLLASYGGGVGGVQVLYYVNGYGVGPCMSMCCHVTP